jgi:histone deacetylase 1/2
LCTPTSTAYLLLYVDDIILTASTTTILRSLITSLHQEFAMSDLGDIHHFLGVTVHRTSHGLFLSQHQYALELLERANMINCHPIATPVDTNSKLSAQDGRKVADPSHYRSIVGALQYLTLTRPDLSYAVQQICLFMHDPRESHLQLVKRILQYVKGSAHLGLQLHVHSSCELVGYSDADWAGCPDTRKSTSGFGVFLGSNLVSWSSKQQHTVSRSSAEAEYRVVANCVAETVWLCQLLIELQQPPPSSTVVYYDNISATYLSSNPVQHQRTKHVEIDLHFVRDRVALGEARVLHVPTGSEYADIFTKGLPTAVFEDFRSSLNILSSPVSTAGVLNNVCFSCNLYLLFCR